VPPAPAIGSAPAAPALLVPEPAAALPLLPAALTPPVPAARTPPAPAPALAAVPAALAPAAAVLLPAVFAVPAPATDTLEPAAPWPADGGVSPLTGAGAVPASELHAGNANSKPIRASCIQSVRTIEFPSLW
jgi:hypothetical protein